jgi:ABC-type antimicrobial peptide transport system permease subunit
MAELVVILGGVAWILAIVGIYATISFAVSQRMKEVAVRIALGAQKGNIFRALVTPCLRPIVIGLIVGFLMAAGASTVLDQVLRNTPASMNTHDPLSYVIVSVLFACVAFAAMLGPARRAAACDPIVALREE